MEKLKFKQKSKIDKKEEDRWKVLIVDDDSDVHTITKSVLSEFEFGDKRLEFISAYSAMMGFKIVEENPDIAVVLLDVMMETDHAGLELVKQVRDELKNRDIRIILRTGQSGFAPLKEVVENYDINDYKEKTELTSDKLYATVMTALRSYRDLLELKKSNQLLKKLASKSAIFFKYKDFDEFIHIVFHTLKSVTDNCIAVTMGKDKVVFHRTVKDEELKKFILNEATNDLWKITSIKNGHYVVSYLTEDNYFLNIFIENYKDLALMQKKALKIMLNSILTAFDNICSHEEIIRNENVIIHRLSHILETRLYEPIGHTNRLEKIVYIMALKCGLKKEEAKKVAIASVMHDIGNIKIDESLFAKDGSLSDDEYEEIKKHTTYGYEMLKDCENDVMLYASAMALEHHERYDGSGYPKGLRGDEIKLCARILSIVDTFDTMISKKRYKEMRDFDEAVEFIKSQRAKKFDPNLVDIFLENIDKIKEVYKDDKA